MIVLKRFSAIDNFRHKQALRLIESADKDLAESDNIIRTSRIRTLRDDVVRDKLLKDARSNGILQLRVVNPDQKTAYNHALKRISYRDDRVDTLSHELGHHKNTIATGLRKEIADTNNNKNYRGRRDNIRLYRRLIKHANGMTPEQRKALGVSTNINKSLRNFQNNRKINEIVEAEEKNATKSGLGDLKKYGLNHNKYDTAKEFLNDDYRSYKLVSSANNKYLLSEIVNPSYYRTEPIRIDL